MSVDQRSQRFHDSLCLKAFMQFQSLIVAIIIVASMWRGKRFKKLDSNIGDKIHLIGHIYMDNQHKQSCLSR